MAGFFFLFAVEQLVFGGIWDFVLMLVLDVPLLALGVYLTMVTRNARFDVSAEGIKEFDWRNRLKQEMNWRDINSFEEKQPPRFGDKLFLRLGSANSEFLIPISLIDGPLLVHRILSQLPSGVTPNHFRRAKEVRTSMSRPDEQTFGVIEKYVVTPVDIKHIRGSEKETISWKDVKAFLFECHRLKDKHTYYGTFMLLTDHQFMRVRNDTRYWKDFLPLILALMPDEAIVYLGPGSPLTPA